MKKINVKRLDKAFTAALLHSRGCTECFIPIIKDAEGNPGYFGEACGKGVALLAEYVIASGVPVPPWTLPFVEYYKLPVTVTPAELLQSHGNWGLNEEEYSRAKNLAQQIMKQHA